MNAYFVNAGWQDVVQEVIDYWPRTEPTFLCDVVFAETRGQAKSIFLRHVDGGAYVEYTDVRCKTLRRGVRRKGGLASWKDPYWMVVR